jgi:hypothetical protein
MPCNCGKRRVVAQPKKVVKAPPRKTETATDGKSTTTVKRIIRRAAR